MLNPLSKFAESKQSDLSAKERQKVGKIIGWIPKANVRDKKILLVDDVYTTGSTIKACISLLQKHGARKIEVLVMSKTFFRRA
jgi:competence protein ComFC